MTDAAGEGLTSGSSLQLYNHPDELVEKLMILVGEKDSGNDSVKSDIITILDELFKKSHINRKEYEQFVISNSIR